MQKILDIAHRERIYIAYRDLQSTGDAQGLYFIHPRAGPMILLDKSLLTRPKQHRCIAAHELGHHFYPPRNSAIAFHRSNHYSNISSQTAIIIQQDENKALHWATELLMPSEEVWAAIKEGYNTVHLLADIFNVTEWFVRAKIGFLRREERDQERKVKWRDMIKREL